MLVMLNNLQIATATIAQGPKPDGIDFHSEPISSDETVRDLDSLAWRSPLAVPAERQTEQPHTWIELAPWLASRYPQSFEGWIWIGGLCAVLICVAKLIQAIDGLQDSESK
jgi:hypothetical protein